MISNSLVSPFQVSALTAAMQGFLKQFFVHSFLLKLFLFVERVKQSSEQQLDSSCRLFQENAYLPDHLAWLLLETE